MKTSAIVLFFLIFAGNINGQEFNAQSPVFNFNVTKDQPKPPFLEIDENSFNFKDANGNSMIDAGETGKLSFLIKNTGTGDGYGLNLKVAETTGAQGISVQILKPVGNVIQGGNVKAEFEISGGLEIQDGKAVFNIEIEEPYGFNPEPVSIELVTRAFRKPNLVVADYSIQLSGGTRIQKRKPFDVNILVQNIGQGEALQSQINLTLPEKVFCVSANDAVELGNVKSGETKKVTFNLVANSDYSSAKIPLTFHLSEKYGKYGETKELVIEIDQEYTQHDLMIQPAQLSADNQDIALGALTSAVDRNIPVSEKKYPNRFALIIGNENYTDYQSGLNSEMNVDYARNDATVFRQYAIDLLGIEERNVFFVADATAGRMNQEISRVEAILKRLGNKSELFFYFAGHGLPDENTKSAYLIPVDVTGSNLSSAIKLNDLYQRFAETGAGRITIFLDACFSGGGRSSGLMAARSVKVKPKVDLIPENIVVFTASSGEQSSLPFHQEKHGMFTYFLLKKLQASKGTLNYRELADYLKSEVSIESIRVNSKEQDPDVLVSPALGNEWEGWKLNP